MIGEILVIYLTLDDVASSNIKQMKFVASVDNNDMINFNHTKGTLTIVYGNDSMYNYFDVPLATIGNLFIHDSIGKSVSSLIKPHYESERVGK